MIEVCRIQDHSFMIIIIIAHTLTLPYQDEQIRGRPCDNMVRGGAGERMHAQEREEEQLISISIMGVMIVGVV